MVTNSPEVPSALVLDVEAADLRGRGGLKKWLFAPVDIAPLVFFRMAFGALMFLEVVGSVAIGEFRENWVEPEMHFTYFGFGWVKAPPGNWAYLLPAVTAVAALGVMFGAFYKLSAALFAVGIAWTYLIEQSTYNNHYYLICLVAIAASFVPAERALSIDARRRPELRASTAPAWTLWLIQAHMAIAYFFGAIAKMNADWLQGEPVRRWLSPGGSLASKVVPALQNDFGAYLISYGGLFFDLLVVPFLLWKKTRVAALVTAIVFHLLNAYLFDIGVFPFLSIAMTCLFLSPAWHRKVLRLGSAERREHDVYWKRSVVVVALLGVYAAYHLLMPFRHWFYPGNSQWTEEGHRYSWHMMLRHKTGYTHFIVDDKTTGKVWKVRPEEYLSKRQFQKMAVHPEMLLQFARYLRTKWEPNDVTVHAVASVKLNHHKQALLVDPEVDLSRQELSLLPRKWILPLDNQETTPVRFWRAAWAEKR